MPEPYPVYVVDDDVAVRDWIADACEEQGRACTRFENGEDFIAALDGMAPGCVLLDMRMPRVSGLQVQAELVRRGSRLAVVAITGYGGVDVAVQAMKMGAVEFLEKPFTLDDLAAACAAADRRLAAPAA